MSLGNIGPSGIKEPMFKAEKSVDIVCTWTGYVGFKARQMMIIDAVIFAVNGDFDFASSSRCGILYLVADRAETKQGFFKGVTSWQQKQAFR